MSKPSARATADSRFSIQRLFVLALSLTLALAPLSSPSPAWSATPPPRVAARYPSVPLHAEYTVETNKLGQVVRVRSAQASPNATFNTITRGNALQAFIRRPNGTAIAGVYKLLYDYSPKTKMVHRDVRLVRAGGVDPNAKGAVTQQLEQHPPAQHPVAPASEQPATLPDFNKIVK